jgi:hypothetical protein
MKIIKLICLLILLSIGVSAQNYIGWKNSNVITDVSNVGLHLYQGVTSLGTPYIKVEDPNQSTTKHYFFSQGICYFYSIEGRYALYLSYVKALNDMGVRQSDGTWTVYGESGIYTSWFNTEGDNTFILFTTNKTYD